MDIAHIGTPGKQVRYELFTDLPADSIVISLMVAVLATVAGASMG